MSYYHWSQFVRESNRIEGILREPSDKEIKATETFVMADIPTVESLSALARVYASAERKP